MKFNKKLSRTQLIALGFLLIIIVGTILLMLPISSKNGESTNFLGALFTATSATCVTGLIVFDTYTKWTVFGQLVILVLIQIGGLGFVTIGVYGMTLLRKRIGLKDREFIHDSLNSLHVGGGVNLVKRVVKGTLLFEGLGALILAIRFTGDFGLLKGIYYGIFHSVSAFCNAGFDLMGFMGEYCSLTGYYNDFVVNIVIILLIIIGGLGFLVWDDISKNKLHFKKYMLHTKIVLSVTTLLLIGATVFFYFSEADTVFADMNFFDRFLSSAFASVTPRTAGFNTVDIASMSAAGKLMTILLMFIGGSPGSTAGGVKTTSLAAIFFFILSYIKRQKSCNVYKRSLENDLIKKASTVFFINLTLAITALLVILLHQEFSFLDVAIEVFSAIGTVGMSAGITRDLSVVSKLVLIALMYCGRVGSLSFALSFSESKKIADIRYPTEEILIG